MIFLKGIHGLCQGARNLLDACVLFRRSSYRSLSTGSGGSMWFRMPSRPAISCAEKARNGLQDGSGARNSMRFAAGEVPASGIRMAAERLRAESPS